MNSRLRTLLAILALPLLFQAAAAPDQALDFKEVFGLVRSNLTDISEAELDKAAALGLLEQLGSKVQLISTNAAEQAAPGKSVTRTAVYGRNFGYLRIESIAQSLPSDLRNAWKSLSETNRLRGAILDLRYAKGQDYAAAAQAANLFVQNEQTLIKAGEHDFRSSLAGEKIKSPVAVLVNRKTSGAAEALAATLREAGAALLIGSTTAGEARLFQVFELSTGQKLSIGKLPVFVGGKPIPAAGVAPDIHVEVSTLDERAYYQDPFAEISRGLAEVRSTNEVALASPRGRRFNEAELVRRHREGLDIDAPPDEAPAEPGRQFLQDPALARAVDFLKGLSALRPTPAE